MGLIGDRVGMSPMIKRQGSRRTFDAIAIPFAIILAVHPFIGRARAEPVSPIIVKIDKATLLRLPKGHHQVIQGSPIILRVAQLEDLGIIVLTGTSFGETNLIVLNDAGKVEMDRTILVRESRENGIVVYRGPQRLSYYDCERRCSVTSSLGNSELGGNQGARLAAMAQGAAAPSAPTRASSRARRR